MAEQHVLNNRYEVQEILGRGGFAVTYRAIDTHTGDVCAIKCLSFRKIKEWKTWELFEREARILKNLNHPKIPRYIDFFTQETDQDVELYLVQAYVAGQSLAQLVQEGRHFSEAEARRLALKLCDLLAYLHHLSPPIVHRDLKPGNILLDAENRLFLIDFGAVKDTIMTDYVHSLGAPTVVGTYGYMPLEQIEGRALPQSDLYALGMTLIAILSHKEPADIEKTGLTIDFRPHVNISADFAAIITKLIAPDWQRRYQSAGEVKADLKRLEQKSLIPLHGAAAQRRAPIRRAVAIAGAMVVLLGIAWYWLAQNGSPPPPPPLPVARDDTPIPNANAPINAMPTIVTPAATDAVHTLTPVVTATPRPSTPTLAVTATPWAKIVAPMPFPTAMTMPTATPVAPTPFPTVTAVPTATPFTITGPVVRGRLVFAGQSITAVSNQAPSFWFRNEDTGQEQTAHVTYQNGEFTIYGLTPGNFGISVNLDANPQNPWSYPGDYRAWEAFTVQVENNPELVVSLLKLIRMTAPQDNNEVMDKWDAECMQKITFHNPITFQWEVLGYGVVYDYEIMRMDCLNSYNQAGVGVEGSVTGTQITVNLPPSLNNECYGFHLYARQNGQRIGMLMTHGDDGYGWDYRFRVQ